MPLLDFLFGSKKKEEKDLFEKMEDQIKEQVKTESLLKEEHQKLPDMFEGRELEEPIVRLDAMMEAGRELQEEPVPVPDWLEEPSLVELPNWFGGREVEEAGMVRVPGWFGGRELIGENYFALKTLFEGEGGGQVELPHWFEEREVVAPHLQRVVPVPDFITKETMPNPPSPDVSPPSPKMDKVDKIIQPWLESLEDTLRKHKTHSIAHMFPSREPSHVEVPEFIHQHHRLEEIDAMPEGTLEEVAAKIEALKELEED